MSGTTIFESTKIRYLGLILDQNLSWKHHIFELRKKLSRAVGILYKMRSLNCSKPVLLSLYYSLFHSHLCYGICLYGLAEPQYISKIILIQKRAIRILSKSPFNAHTEPLFKKLRILNFSKTLEFQFSVMMWQHDHGELPTCFNNFFKRVTDIHEHSTRAASLGKFSETSIINTVLHGKQMLQFIGPKIFNKIVDLDFYKKCKNKASFKKKNKQYLIDS